MEIEINFLTRREEENVRLCLPSLKCVILLGRWKNIMMRCDVCRDKQFQPSGKWENVLKTSRAFGVDFKCGKSLLVTSSALRERKPKQPQVLITTKLAASSVTTDSLTWLNFCAFQITGKTFLAISEFKLASTERGRPFSRFHSLSMNRRIFH